MKNAINKFRGKLIAFFGAVLAVCVCAFAAMTFTSVKAEDHIEDISAYTLADYVTVQNSDVGADPAGFTDPNYAKYYSFATAYSTTSMVYKFRYQAIDTGTYVALRDTNGGWGGYQFIFSNGKVQYYVDGVQKETEALLTSGTTYEIELGSIDTTTEGKTYIYVKIDGEYKVQRITNTLSSSGCGFGIWGGRATGTFMQSAEETFPYQGVDYVSVQNFSLGLAESVNSIETTYSTKYSNTSMTYKAKVTPDSGGVFYIKIRGTSGWGEDGYMFKGLSDGKIQVSEKGVLFVTSAANDYTSGDTIEVGAIDLVGLNKTYLFAKVNGIVKYSTVRDSVDSSSVGNYVMLSSATFAQVDDAASFLDDYVTVQNFHLGAAESVSSLDGATYASLYSTTSMTYKAKITGNGNVKIRAAAAWSGGYQFNIIDGGKVQVFEGASHFATTDAIFTTGDTVEYGAIDLVGLYKTYIFIKINDVVKYSTVRDSVDSTTIGNMVTAWGGTFAQVDDTASFLEDYVTVQNADLGTGKSVSSLEAATYTSSYSTTSVVYKAKITNTADVGIRIRETAAWANGYCFVFSKGGGTVTCSGNGFSDVSAAWDGNFTGNTVEVGAVDLKGGSGETYVFVKVDGTTLLSALVSNSAVSTGKAVTLWAATFEDVEYSDVDEIDETKLASYITLTNTDLGMDASYVNESGNYNYFWRYNGNEADTAATLTSLTYKFTYTVGNGTYIALRDTKEGGWSGYYFVFASDELQYSLGDNANLRSVKNVFSSGTTHKVELGAIDLADGSGTYIFAKIDGVLKVAKTRTSVSDTDSGVAIWSNGTSGTFGQLGESVTPSLLDGNYQVLQNNDFTWKYGSELTDKGQLPSVWTFTRESYITFTPSAANTTRSFVWKTIYTQTGAGNNMYIIIPVNGYWKYPLAEPIFFDIGNYFGTDDVNKSVELEIGVIRLAGSDTDCLFYVKLDGTYKVAVTKALGGDGVTDTTVGGLFFFSNKTETTDGIVYIAGSGTFSEYPYAYTIKDNDGNTLASGSAGGGLTISFDTASLTDGTKVFAGFLYNGKLYKSISDVMSAKEKGDLEITAKTVNLSIEDGAYIKLVDDGATIKFKAFIETGAKTDASIASFGMIVADYTYINENNLDITHETLESYPDYYRDINSANNMKYTTNPDDASEYYYALYFNSIGKGNYGSEYAARAYVKVTYADNSTKYIYTPYSKENNVRSIYEVASSAIDYVTEDSYKTILQKYIDGVMVLDSNFELVGNDRSYTISVSGPTDDSYTITITPKEGFDISGIGSVYIAGKKIGSNEYGEVSKENRTVKFAESAAAVAVFESNVTAASTSTKKLEVFAYEGPKVGTRFDSKGTLGYAGGTATLAVLKEYMDAGFTHWSVSDASYGNYYLSLEGGGFTAKGTGISHTHYDVFWALDLAAEYAATYHKPCPVYVTIPDLINLGSTTNIGAAYDELINYVDANGEGYAYSPVNGRNQLAGFALKDEPTWAQYDNFATVFNYIAYTKGAIAAGYGFECALLQTYTVSEYINGDYAAYVAKYAALLKDTAISFDNYPCNYTPAVDSILLWKRQSESYSMEESWFYDMQTIRAQSNKVYGTCIQSYTAGQANSESSYKRTTCKADITMQVYTALAYGFTRLSYFTYWQRDTDLLYANTTECLQDTMIRWEDYEDWTKGYTYSNLYYWGKDANAKATKLAEILMKFDSCGVQLVQGSSNTTNFGSASTTNTTNAITASSTGALVVGGFKCGAYNGYLASNVTLPHDNVTATATFTFGAGYTKAIVYKDGEPSLQTLSDGGVLTMNIASGDGVFIVPIA